MIISHKLKLIYIKLYKVAGSSFEVALSKYCGENDIVTSIDKDGDALRDSLGYFPSSRLSKLAGHLAAPRIKLLVSPDIWNNYLKVASVRNPYDQHISGYFFRERKLKDNFCYDPARYSFSWYVKHNYLADFDYDSGFGFMNNMRRLHDGGKIAADFLIRFEHLDEDIKKLEKKINCLGLLQTFQDCGVKKGIRPEEASLYEMYSKHPREKLIIDSMYYENINKYEFIGKYWLTYKAELESAIGNNVWTLGEKLKYVYSLRFLKYVWWLINKCMRVLFIPQKARIILKAQYLRFFLR